MHYAVTKDHKTNSKYKYKYKYGNGNGLQISATESI
jgi:hypothetical protein